MTEQIHYEEPRPFNKPADDFTAYPSTSSTVFYLAVIKPHTDTYTIHGPAKHFTHLLPKIEDIVSNSPSAIDKLILLREGEEDVWGEREKNLDFEENGFSTFVVEGQRGTYTVLKILCESNVEVHTALPAPVFTVTVSGPLTTTPTYSQRAQVGGKPTGYASATRLVGSFVDLEAAQSSARQAMGELTSSVLGVKHTETWDKEGNGGGVMMAMMPGRMWEVKIGYEGQALRRAREGLDREGQEVGWRS